MAWENAAAAVFAVAAAVAHPLAADSGRACVHGSAWRAGAKLARTGGYIGIMGYIEPSCGIYGFVEIREAIFRHTDRLYAKQCPQTL